MSNQTDDTKNDSCGCTVIHEESVARVRKMMPPDETLVSLSDFFKILGDATRIKIFYALSVCEMCGCDLAALLGVTSSAISHQLRLMRQARLVRFRKEGKIVYYALNDDHVKQIFRQGLEHVEEV